MAKFVTAREAIESVESGDMLMVNSFFTTANPQQLLVALNRRIEEKDDLRDLSIFCPGPFGYWDVNFPSEQCMKHSQAVTKFYCGHYASIPIVSDRVARNDIEAYNFPMGTMCHMIRASAARSPFYITKTGLNCFADPRVGHCGLNERSKEQWIKVVELGGQEYLSYKTPEPNVAIMRGTSSDEKGNISFEKEYSVADALTMAQAVKTNGGTVIVQVERISTEHRRPWNIIIPGVLVDYVVVCPEQGQSSDAVYDSRLSGDVKPTREQLLNYVLETKKLAVSPADGGKAKRGAASELVWTRAAKFLEDGDRVNIGIGLPEGVGFRAAESGMLSNITLLVETGGIGGVPIGGKGFGATVGADCYLSMVQNFDFYDGGGICKSFVGCLEIDGKGDINAHYVNGFIAGIGGFINVTQRTKNVYFCTTFTAGGLEVEVENGSLKILSEGKTCKFVEKVRAVSFSSKNSAYVNQQVYIITERCVLKREKADWKLLEIVKGVDLQRDVLDKIPFKVVVGDGLKVVDAE